jgi:effector-binding domain-containing protein
VKRIVYAILGLVVLAVVVGLALPRRLHVEVTRDIDAHPATVFALVNDFHRVDLWAPLNDSDPNARIVYSGPDRGAGAAVRWDGAIAGSGTQIITDSLPYERVETIVNSGADGESRSWYRLEKIGDGTRLTWGFETDYGFNIVGRYIALLRDDVVRRDHETALTSLDQLAESLPAADFSDIQIENLSVEAQTIAYLPTTSVPEPAAMSDAMGAAYFEILSFIDAHGLREAGAPMSITRSFSGGTLLFDAAIPVRGLGDETPREDGAVRIGETYAGPVIRVRHVGPYRTLGDTHRKIAAYLAALGITRAGPAWEAYVSDPTKVPEDELVTYVYYPVVSADREPAAY